MKESHLKNLLVNIRAFATLNIRKGYNDNTKRIKALEEIAANAESDFKQRFLYHSIISHYAAHRSESVLYRKELDYLQTIGTICTFPYPLDIEKGEIAGGYDQKAGLPYVMHNLKKLYFPSSYSVDDAVYHYKYMLFEEKLLGEGEDKAPHQYQSQTIRVEDGDVLLDIGSAEGLFALDKIENVSRAVLVESGSEWIEPLKHTFAPYGQKVDIIQSFISSADTKKTTSLNSLLSKYGCPSMFVKMDIEGNELPAISAAKELLDNRKGIKLSIASYHKQQDYEELKKIFDKLGYYNESSIDYMIFHMYDMPVAPFFRHGLIRAKN